MGILEQVMSLKNQGIPEGEIIKKMQEQGIPPRAISDALSQAQIKSAVSQQDYENTESMQPSIMESNEMQIPQEEQNENLYQPQTQEIQQEYFPQESQMQTPYSQEQYYQPQQAYSTGIDTDSVIEIAEQVFSEKIKILQQQISQLNEFKTISATKIEGISSRLKRIESIIDKLEIAILGKIGSYAQSIDSIKKEMSMMQDTFSKSINKKHKK